MAAGAATGGKLIALTFDDGPGPYTDRLLDGLAARGVKATFFTLGMRAETYPKVIRRMFAEGHQIANHSYNHPNFNELSDEQIRRQIQDTTNILNKTIGQNFHYLVRPPYGNCNNRVAGVLKAPAIIWSVDPNDWKDRNAETVKKRVVSNAFDGAIVLCHDIYSTSVNGILNAIDILQNEGYEFVTVNELFRRRGLTLKNGGRYYSMKPSGTDLGPVAVPEPAVELTETEMKVSFDTWNGAAVYYTADGSNPLTSGIRYTKPFSVSADQTLKYFAAYNLNGSRTSVRTLPMENYLLTPEFCIRDDKIEIQNQNPGYKVHYTVNGTEPNGDSTAYTEPVACFEGVLRFCLCRGGRAFCQNRIYVTAGGNLFWDVPNDKWYFSTADRAVSMHIFKGVGQYRFAPEVGLTRAMFVTALCRTADLMGMNASAKKPSAFPDLTEDWYRAAVDWASENGIVLGYEDGKFRPDKYISREEMCVILDRMLAWCGKKVQGSDLTFADRNRISAWAKESVGRVSAIGLIKGKENNLFAPRDTATRAEAAAVLLRLYDYTEN